MDENFRKKKLSEAIRTYFTMIPKQFSETVQLQSVGPCSVKKYKSSTRLYKNERSYCTRVDFVPKLIPVNYVTVLVFDGDVTYHERVDLVRKTTMRNNSETVNCFPHEKVDCFRTDFVYETNCTERRYIEKLELFPVQKTCVSLTSVKCNPLKERLTNGVNHLYQNGDL